MKYLFLNLLDILSSPTTHKLNGRNTLVERDLKNVEVMKSALFIFTTFRESKLLYVLMVFHECVKKGYLSGSKKTNLL